MGKLHGAVRLVGTVKMGGPFDTESVASLHIYRSEESADLYISAKDIFDMMNVGEHSRITFDEWTIMCGNGAKSPDHVLLAGNVGDAPVLFNAMFVFGDMADFIPQACHKLMPVLGKIMESFLKDIKEGAAEGFVEAANVENECDCPRCRAKRGEIPDLANQLTNQFMNWQGLQASVTTARISQIMHCLEHQTEMGFDDKESNVLRVALLNYLVHDDEMSLPRNMRTNERPPPPTDSFPDFLKASDFQ